MIIIPNSKFSTNSPLPISDDYYFMWHPTKFIAEKFPQLKLLALEQSGKGREFLKIIDVEGWKLCSTDEYPGYPEDTEYPGFAKIDEFFLCRKGK